MGDEIAKERAKQANGAMKRLGPLLDAWEQLPNDQKGELGEFREPMEDLVGFMEFGE